MIKQYGKNAAPVGITPAIVLQNPKFPHNVGAVVRTASCYGFSQVFFTGNRIQIQLEDRKRLPREERMKGYADVDLIHYDYPFDAFPAGTVPVAIEVRENSTPLPYFVHPENPVYVFGPEDGSISKAFLRHCHHFVYIPMAHCANLAGAVWTLAYDRMYKQVMAGAPMPVLNEDRGFYCPLEK